MGGSPPPFATSALAPSAPVPLSAVYTTATLTLVVTFDQALIAKALGGGGPWVIRTSNLARPVLSKTFSGNTATIVTGAGIPDPGPNIVIYSPPPNNVESLANGTPATGFSLTPTVI